MVFSSLGDNFELFDFGNNLKFIISVLNVCSKL